MKKLTLLIIVIMLSIAWDCPAQDIDTNLNMDVTYGASIIGSRFSKMQNSKGDIWYELNTTDTMKELIFLYEELHRRESHAWQEYYDMKDEYNQCATQYNELLRKYNHSLQLSQTILDTWKASNDQISSGLNSPTKNKDNSKEKMDTSKSKWIEMQKKLLSK